MHGGVHVCVYCRQGLPPGRPVRPVRPVQWAACAESAYCEDHHHHQQQQQQSVDECLVVDSLGASHKIGP